MRFSNFSNKLIPALFSVAMMGFCQVSAMDLSGPTMKLAWEGAGPNEGIEVSLSVAKQSGNIKAMISDLGEEGLDQPIPLHKVSESILHHVVACMKIIAEGGSVENYVQKISAQSPVFFDLSIAANYLDIGPLLDACMKQLLNAVILQFDNIDWIGQEPKDSDTEFKRLIRSLPSDLMQGIESFYKAVNDVVSHCESPEMLLTYVHGLQEKWAPEFITRITQLGLKKANKSLDTIKDEDGNTILLNATPIDIKILLDVAGWDLVFIPNNDGFIVFQMLPAGPPICVEVAKAILAAAPSPELAWKLLTFQGDSGQTVLQQAVLESNVAMVKALLAYANELGEGKARELISIKDANGMTALALALGFGNLETIKVLMEAA